MKKQKVLALVLSLVMVVSMLAACGKTEPTDKPSDKEVSVDFEDSKSGFALIKSGPRKADLSTLTVKDVNGTKVLYVTNNGADAKRPEMHLAIDLDGMLGAKITDLAKVEVTIGVDRPGSSKFAAIAGSVYTYSGDGAGTETKAGQWSVYSASKNPQTYTFDVSGAGFVAGQDNYMTIVKEEDTAATAGNFFVDDIRFLDKDGKLIECNKDAIMEPVGDKFIYVEEIDVSAGVVFKDEMVPEGEWKQDCIVPAGFFKGFEGQAVELTIKYEVIPGDAGYLCWGLCNNEWKKLTKDLMAPGAALLEGAGMDNGDGLFAIDRDATELKVVLSPEAVAALNDGFFGLTYHVDVYEISAKAAGADKVTEKVEGDAAYTGDWTLGGVVPAEVLAKFDSDIDVTLKFELTGDKDYYIACPKDSWWAETFGATGDILGLEVMGAADPENPTFHLQADGGLVIDDRGLTELTYTLSAAAVKRMVADGKGLGAMVYGVTIYEVVITGKAPSTITEKVEGDAAYTGDWTLGGVVPPEVIAKFDSDINVTLKFELTGDKDYYIACPKDSWWAETFGATGDILGLEVMGAADPENPTFHLQADGGLVIDNRELTELTYTLSAAAVKRMVADGKGLGAMVYGVTIYEVVITGSAPESNTIKEKVEEETVATDWGQDGIVPVDVLAKFAGDVTVTFKYEVVAGKDQSVFAPMDESWGKIYVTVPGSIAGLEEADEIGKIKPDGFIKCDPAGESMTFTLTAAGVAYFVEKGVNFSGQAFGLDIYEIVLEGAAK